MYVNRMKRDESLLTTPAAISIPDLVKVTKILDAGQSVPVTIGNSSFVGVVETVETGGLSDPEMAVRITLTTLSSVDAEAKVKEMRRAQTKGSAE